MEIDDLKYARCKACDAQFYPAWIPKRLVFEELCHACRHSAMKAAYLPEDTEDNFLDGYLMDKGVEHGD